MWRIFHILAFTSSPPSHPASETLQSSSLKKASSSLENAEKLPRLPPAASTAATAKREEKVKSKVQQPGRRAKREQVKFAAFAL